MASSVLLGLAIVIGLLSITATARPCKTLLISSYSFPNPHTAKNPNPNDFSSSSSGFATVFTEIHQFNPYRASYPSEIVFNRKFFPVFVDEPQIQRPRRPLFPLAYDFSSLRDRTKDILSVVVALLFGVGCGALTAATVYLVWTLFANRYDYGSSFSQFDEDESDDDNASPKKIGYVKIPAAVPVDSVPAPLKVAK